MSDPLTNVEKRQLEAKLYEKLRQACDESESIGYPPRQFRVMLTEGAVSACIRDIMAPKIPDGFLELLERNRLDLTAEAIVLQWPWRPLFDVAVLEQARTVRPSDMAGVMLPCAS